MSCSGNDEDEKSGVKSYDDQKAEAMASLESVFSALAKNNVTDPTQIGNFDFVTPKNKFEELAKQRPSDADVKVSLALCQMMSLYADPQFKSYIAEMTNNGIIQPQDRNQLSIGFIPFNMVQVISNEMLLENVFLMINKGISDPNDIDALQNHFRTVIIPQLTSAIKNLEDVEALSTPLKEYQYAITGKMMGLSSGPTVYMDNTEFYMMDSYLEYLKSNLSLYCIIDFKNSDFTIANPDSLTEADLPAILSQATLYSYGNDYAQFFANDMKASSQDMLKSLVYLQSETDAQNDDVIRKNPNLTNAMIGQYILDAQAAIAEWSLIISAFIDGILNPPSTPV